MKIKYILIGLLLSLSVIFFPRLVFKNQEFAIVLPIFSILIFGCLGVGYGLGWMFPPKHKEEKVSFLYIPTDALENIKNVQRYMEHFTPAETLQRAVAYYALALEIVQNNEGKIVIRHVDGGEELFDPVSIEVPPIDENKE